MGRPFPSNLVRRRALTLPPGLIFDLDADKITRQADNSNLLSWTDSVGGNQFVNPSGVLKYRAAGGAGKGGRAYVTGANVTNSYLQCAYANLNPSLIAAYASGEITIVCVLDNVGVRANALVFGQQSGQSLQADGTQVGFYAQTGGYMPWASGVNYTGSTGYVSFGATSTLKNRSQLLSSFRPYFRGLPQAENGQRQNALSSSQYFAIGAQQTGINNFVGDMYRFLIWPRELQPSEMLQVEFYLNDRYGQTHPINNFGKYLIFDGDSRESNFAGGSAPSQYLNHRVASGLTTPFPVGTYANFAIPHGNIPQITAKADYETDIMQYWFPNIPARIFYEEFYNSSGLSVGSTSDYGTSVATLAGATYNYWAGRRKVFGPSAKFIGATAYSYGTGSNSPSLASAWGQFFGSGNANDSTTGSNNWQNMLLNGTRLLDGFCDFWADTTMGGINAAATNPSYWAESGTSQLHAGAIGQQWLAGWTATGSAGASGSPFGVIQAMNGVSGW